MKNQRLHWIDPSSPPDAFPPVEIALSDPDGLLAVGGDLGSERLLSAYERGIFPWFVDGQPILWWSPDPRCVLYPQEFHASRSLKRAIRRSTFTVTRNLAFRDVILACAEPRPYQQGTWITQDMLDAYTRLHAEGWAHSVEIHDGDELVGGIYGLAIGRVFFGESMFSRRTNASKMAFLGLCNELTKRDFELVDCQVESPHLVTLGARMIPRRGFSRVLGRACHTRTPMSGFSAGETAVAALLE